MLPYELQENQLTLEEGWLCLDFANTVEWHASDHPVEMIPSYADLIEWFRKVGLLDESGARRLLDEAERQPEAAAKGLAEARALREAIYRMMTAEAQRQPAQAKDLELLNAHLARAFSKLQVIPTENGFGWGGEGEAPSLEDLLGQVARSAAGLMTSPEAKRIGQCANEDGCGWLFFDTSKNHSRRWCSMGSCGNRAKAQRYYRRSQAVTS